MFNDEIDLGDFKSNFQINDVSNDEYNFDYYKNPYGDIKGNVISVFPKN